MGTPDGKRSATSDNSAVSIDEQVNSALKEITVGEDGSYVFPEDTKLSPELRFAATAEKRRRDTQSSFTKSQQSLKAMEAEKEELLNQLKAKTTVELTPEQKEELEDLKLDNPDAWRSKLNQYEAEAKAAQNEVLANLTGDARKAAEQQFELERRQKVLEAFNESAAIEITDERISNDVPPRITQKLEKGEITFEDFLEEVHTYLNKGKTTKKEETPSQPSLGNLGGGNTPYDMKPAQSLSEDYAATTF